VVGVADFTRDNAGAEFTSTVVVDGGDTGGVPPPGGVPVAVAVLLTEPASKSACVTT
jgi:hypothetical protein